MTPPDWKLFAAFMGFGVIVVLFTFAMSACSPEGRERLREIFGLSVGRKPRIRIRSDGWVRHDGRSFPFAPTTVVEIINRGGEHLLGADAEYAEFWPDSYWEWRAATWRRNIMFYRIVGLPAVLETCRV